MNKKTIKQAYKDQKPEKTITQIKKTLESLGIKLAEMTYTPPHLNNIYSMRVYMKDLPDVGANGKGTTPIYARASAYAEFLERLANNFIFDVDLYTAARYQHDAKKVIMNDFVNSPLLGYRRYQKDFFHNFISTYNLGVKETYAVPFKSIDSDKIIWFPLPFFCLYGSNGMAAGNSYYEMSVQALSEILERYALSNVLHKRAKPKVYDNKKVIAKLPNLKPIFNSLIKQKCHIKIYDCSINKGLPVFAVIVFSSDYKLYSVSFGSHPNAGYAIERCFTEIFQGLSNITFRCDTRKKVVLPLYNLRDIMHCGFGIYSKEFLNASEPSNNYAMLEQKFSSNQEMYNYLLGVFKRNKMPLYYRDASYLNLAVGQFIVPGLSYISVPNKFQFDLLYTKNQYYPLLLKFFQLDETKKYDLFELLDLLDNCSQRLFVTTIASKYSQNNDENFYLLMLIYSAYHHDLRRLNKYYLLLGHRLHNKNKKSDIAIKQLAQKIVNAKREELRKTFDDVQFHNVICDIKLEKMYLKKLLEQQKKYYHSK